MARELVFTVTAKDCDWSDFLTSGAGGQKRDKVRNGQRCRHRPSGAVGQCGEHRSQRQNKQEAFRRMGESLKFQAWARAMVAGLPPIEEVVDKMVAQENLKIEYV